MELEQQQQSGRADAMASDVANLPEGELIAFCVALDQNLRQSAEIGLSEIAYFIEQNAGDDEEELSDDEAAALAGGGGQDFHQGDQGNVFPVESDGGDEEAAMAAAAMSGGRGRVFMR